LNLAKTGNSDSHTVDTMGVAATEFDGNTATELLSALRNKTTRVRRQKEWSALRILGSWGIRYMGSSFVRLTGWSRA
jgi:hypothetical protein